MTWVQHLPQGVRGEADDDDDGIKRGGVQKVRGTKE